MIKDGLDWSDTTWDDKRCVITTRKLHVQRFAFSKFKRVAWRVSYSSFMIFKRYLDRIQ